MNRRTLSLVALSASLLTGGFLLGQTKSKSSPAAPAPQAQPPQQQKLARVATLTGIEANREFQANVQLLQAQRQAAVDLDAQVGKEKDAKKKAELQKQLEQLMTKLNENNDKMAKAYGFSLSRNYTMVIETAHIYTFVTDEEAAAVEKAEKAQQAEEAKKAKGKKK